MNPLSLFCKGLDVEPPSGGISANTLLLIRVNEVGDGFIDASPNGRSLTPVNMNVRSWE